VTAMRGRAYGPAPFVLPSPFSDGPGAAFASDPVPSDATRELEELLPEVKQLRVGVRTVDLVVDAGRRGHVRRCERHLPSAERPARVDCRG
jgi:hypothetical protein